MVLKSGYFIFGNHGAVWSGNVHIAKAGFDPDTLCGTPMLSTNWARIKGITEPGCAKCIEIYNKKINEKNR